MNIRTALILAAPLALALSGCGRSDSASTEAEADTVEIPANEALQGVDEAPVNDPMANATATPTESATPVMTEEERIQAAGNDAADTAAAAADAMTEDATDAADAER